MARSSLPLYLLLPYLRVIVLIKSTRSRHRSISLPNSARYYTQKHEINTWVLIKQGKSHAQVN